MRHYLDEGPYKIVDILTELSTAASAFKVIFDRPASLPPRIPDAYRHIDRLNVTTALPLLVWLRTPPPGQLPESDHLQAVVAVDSRVVRRLIVGANTRGYGQRFVDVLKAAQAATESGKSVAAAIEMSLLGAGTENLTWPTDADVEWSFVNRPFYDNLTQERIRLLLGAMDHQMHLDHPKGEHPTFDYDALQIEHILPRTWMPYWPVMVGDGAERMLLGQERDRAKNRIGNLTLVTGPLNIPMSNGPWPDKRAALAEHSNLRLNAGLSPLESWDEAAIERRARALAAVALRVWPRPRPT